MSLLLMLQGCTTTPGLCGAKERPEDFFILGKHYHLNYIPRPEHSTHAAKLLNVQRGGAVMTTSLA